MQKGENKNLTFGSKLTVDENIACQGALYGIHGTELRLRRDELLQQLDLTDRRDDRCQVLSGGLKRRVELAKGINENCTADRTFRILYSIVHLKWKTDI